MTEQELHATSIDPIESAKLAGLRYVSDDTPRIRRERQGDTFSYRDTKGQIINDDIALQRFALLGIPPAWEDVWICPRPNGHMQATGRDAKGRKQYRYHPRWRATRDETKYGHVLAFGRALSQIRARVARDFRRRALSRELVLATVVRPLARKTPSRSLRLVGKPRLTDGAPTLRSVKL